MRIHNSFLFLTTLIILCISCDASNKNLVTCALFFNPSQAYYSNDVHFKAKLNDSLILDTIVKNRRVDESELLTCFNFKSSSAQILSIDINGKKQQIPLKSEKHKCLDIFVRIDDHFLLDLKHGQIEQEKRASGKKNNYNSKYILDSLRSNAKNNEYDTVSVNIQNDKCLCK